MFIRSDQYAFVRQGVPAVYLKGGVKPRDGSDGTQLFEDFRSHHYHLPSDDVDHPIHWPGAAQLAHVNYRIGLAVGNERARPAWKPGDFFGEKFGR